LAQALGLSGKPDYEEVKHWIVFPPKDFVDLVLKLKSRRIGLIWEDAGLWLFALDWFDPFVKSAVKYMNVARTDFGGILFNTPYMGMMSRKLIIAPDVLRIKIIKRSSNISTPNRYRFAKAYKPWRSPDLTKHGVMSVFGDLFSAKLPDEFFAWYRPQREKYALVAKKMMLQKIEALAKKNPREPTEQEYKTVVPTPEKIKELSEVVAAYE